MLRVVRRIKKRLRKLIPHNPNGGAVASTSFPMVSGDTFRSIAEVVIDRDLTVIKRSFSSGVIFLNTDMVTNVRAIALVEEVLGELGGARIPRIVLHNSDYSPSEEELRPLLEMGAEIFATNYLGAQPFVTAIPIGIENGSYGRLGLPKRVEMMLSRAGGEEIPRNLVLTSFREGTNPHIREEVAKLFAGSRFGIQSANQKLGDYLASVNSSYFVISPPGNGLDCHRTWEAIYLRAVPVVLEGSLNRNLVKNLPILSVGSYQEFLEHTDSELVDTYWELQQRSNWMAFFPYWAQRILAS